MGRFLRFALVFVLLVAVLVLIVLPLALGPVLAGAVRGSGFHSDTLSVNVALFDPTLVLGQSRKLTLIASGVDASPAQIGDINVSIGNASFFDRTFQTVDGSLNDVSVKVNGQDVHVGDITVSGPADAADATAHLSATDTDALIRLAGKRAGLTIDDVRMSDSGVSVKVSGIDASARVAVSGGALVLDPGVGEAIVLLQPAPSDPWKLQEAWVSADGLNVRATVDVARLARNITGTGGPLGE